MVTSVRQCRTRGNARTADRRADDQRFRVVEVDGGLDDFASQTVYTVSFRGFVTHFAMLCPCGCSSKLFLNALADARPRWRLMRWRGYPSLVPSVHRVIGCQSHFILRRGRIIWCA